MECLTSKCLYALSCVIPINPRERVKTSISVLRCKVGIARYREVIQVA